MDIQFLIMVVLVTPPRPFIKKNLYFRTGYFAQSNIDRFAHIVGNSIHRFLVRIVNSTLGHIATDLRRADKKLTEYRNI